MKTFSSLLSSWFFFVLFWVEGRRSELKGQANMHKVFRFSKKSTRLAFFFFLHFLKTKFKDKPVYLFFPCFFQCVIEFNILFFFFRKKEMNNNGLTGTNIILALVLLLPLVKQSTGRRKKREDNKKKSLKCHSASFPLTTFRSFFLCSVFFVFFLIKPYEGKLFPSTFEAPRRNIR